MHMCFCVLLYFTACMLYYCNTVGWAWWDRGLIWWLTILLQCFDTVGWVTWPVKISSLNDLYCVEWDVKPYSTQLNPQIENLQFCIYQDMWTWKIKALFDYLFASKCCTCVKFYVLQTPLGGIHTYETRKRFNEGCLHPCNILMCPFTCVTNLPKPREHRPGL